MVRGWIFLGNCWGSEMGFDSVIERYRDIYFYLMTLLTNLFFFGLPLLLFLALVQFAQILLRSLPGICNLGTLVNG